MGINRQVAIATSGRVGRLETLRTSLLRLLLYTVIDMAEYKCTRLDLSWARSCFEGELVYLNYNNAVLKVFLTFG